MERRRWVALVALVLLVALGGWWWSSPARPDTEPSPPAVVSVRPVVPAPSPRRRPEAAAVAIPEAPIEEVPVETASDEVRCPVGEALEGRRIQVDGESGPLEARLEAGALVLRPGSAAGTGRVWWGYFRRGTDVEDVSSELRWTGVGTGAGSCVVDHLPRTLDAAVYGRVAGAERLDEGTVFLEGCGLEARGEPTPIDVDGGFFFQTEPGRCRLRAWRRSGMLRLPGGWVDVEPRSGEDVEVSVAVPTFAPAGMGIGFQTVEGGVVVNLVHDGTPAAEAGLTAGDLITSIDGLDTSDMETEDFLQHGIGPEGSEVHLVGESSDGEPFDVVFHRRPIN